MRTKSSTFQNIMQIQFKIIPILLLLTLNTPFVYSQENNYPNNHTLQCTQLSSDTTRLQQNLSQLWSVLIIYNVDKIAYLVVCPIILFLQIIVLVTYIRNSQLRVKPGNIFYGLVIIEMGLNIHILCNTIYRTIMDYNQPMPNSFVPFCLIMCFVYSFFSLNHFMYLVMFMFYTIFIFRFSLKKKSEAFWSALHIFVILASIGLTIFFYFFDFMGLTFYGLCALSSTRRLSWNPILPNLEIICSIFFTILGIFTFVYFNKHMPKGLGFRRKKIEQGKIICMYVTGFSLFEILTSVTGLILDINCTRAQPMPAINILITIVNICRLIEFLFLIFLILYNDKFRNKFKNTLKGIFQTKNGLNTSFHSQAIEMEDIFFDEKLLEMKEKDNQIDLLFLSQVYTIISGIYITYYEYFKKFCEDQKKINLRRINFRDNVLFSIDNKTIMDYETEARIMVKLKVLPCDFIIHCPKIFQCILDMDGLHDIFQSFHIIDNSRKLSNLAEGKGGKSGEFFFFSSDNKYVVKTVTEEEFEFYSQNLEQFYYYFEENPKSLLAKILGLFTIKGDEMQRKYQLILMKNMLGCDRSQIVRIYDLKGSKYDRQVLFEEIEANQISKLTLKDIDFINYQGKLSISYEKAKELRQILKKDTLFLKNLGLLDYSLLIVRVKWQKQPEDRLFWGELQRIPHQHESNQYYHIGLIDYLQKWDLQKKSQKWWKKLTGKHNISAAQPNTYQRRFMQFVDQITSQHSHQGSRFPQISAIQLKNVKVDRAITEPQKQEKIPNSVTARALTGQSPDKQSYVEIF